MANTNQYTPAQRVEYGVRKGGKWMTGHSYTTAHGYRFSWSRDAAEARAFKDDDPTADHLSCICSGKVAPLPPAPQES